MATQIEHERACRAKATEATQRDRGSLMNVGRRVEYALRALCYVAGQPAGRVVPRGEIESHQAVPAHFLSKILRALVEAGILTSAPGVHGGFRLTRPPVEITFRDVFEAIEGHLSLTECVRRGDDSCGFMAVCTQRGIWLGAQQALLDYLQRVSIAEIADTRGLVHRAKQVRQSRTAPAPKPL
jgi:Rrf2 family transcriptional regulator, cysteine metabolism repressor